MKEIAFVSDETDSCNAYIEELNKLRRRFHHEFQLSNASAIGCLVIEILDIYRDSKDEKEFPDPEKN
jgi:hypothetical protein